MRRPKLWLTIVGLAAVCAVLAAAPAQAACSCTCSGSYCGGSGGDTINGNSNNNCIDGNGGADTLYGNAGEDILLGDGGLDTLYGGSGDDCLDGGADSDYLDGGTGSSDECNNGETVVNCETGNGPCASEPPCGGLDGTSCSDPGGFRSCKLDPSGACGHCNCQVVPLIWNCTL